MDRAVERRLVTGRRLALALGGVLLLAVIGYALRESLVGASTARVPAERVRVEEVQRAPFREYVSATGTLAPRTTVYLDAVEGGRVEEVFVEAGSQVEGGQPILRLSNPSLQLSVLSAEAQRIEQTSRIETARFQIAQDDLRRRQDLVDMDYQIQRLSREHERNRLLYEKGLLAAQDYETTRDELDYQRRRRALSQQQYRQDSLQNAAQARQMAESVRRLDRNFALAAERLEALVVRAPVTGQLTALEAEVGALHGAGTRFGQVDVLDGFRVEAQLDEFYLPRIYAGLTGETVALGGRSYPVEVRRVYPQVVDGRFRVDLAFPGGGPGDARRGQSVRLRLHLAPPLGQSAEEASEAEALVLPRGAFVSETGGRWAFVASDDGFYERRAIRLGRQNDEVVEVLGGLSEGDRVIVSAYDAFARADRVALE
jgi:HlyD family secretion protein